MASSKPGKRSSLSKPNNNNNSILSRASAAVSSSPILAHTKRATSDAGYVANRLLRSTGKAAWIAGTTFLILVVPLIIEMDREQQVNELDLQQASLLGTPSVLAPPK